MVLFRIRFRAARHLREQIVKAVRRVVGPTRATNGCTAANGYVSIDDENSILYLEQWESQSGLDAHLRSDDMKVLLSVIDLATEFPDVRFDTIAETRGMEVIAAARSGGGPADAASSA